LTPEILTLIRPGSSTISAAAASDEW